MRKINAFLWFDSEAEQAAKFYVGIFKNSKIGKIARYPKEAAEKTGRPPGSAMTVEFTLDRVEFVALNGGPQFKFTAPCRPPQKFDPAGHRCCSGRPRNQTG